MSANAANAAPTGRKTLAQGKARSDAALGHDSPNTPSPEGVKQGGTLPNGWRCYSLGETCDILAGFGFPERFQGKSSGDLPFYKVGDISETWKRGDTFLTRANHYVSHADCRELRAKPLPANTTVFAKIGAAIALNRRAILSVASLVDNNVMGLYPRSDELDSKFLFHFACTLNLDELSRATTVPSIRKSDIEAITIPLPSLPEQRRIVAEIEKQFTRLEAGVAALRRVQANLKRYRAAVLKAACEGKLVPTEHELSKAKGRRQKDESTSSFLTHTSSYESGEALLARILTERRQNWLARRSLGEGGQGRGKYKEPASLDTSKLFDLPEGWTWTTLDSLAEIKGGITKDRNRKHTTPVRSVPYLRVANVQRGYIDLTEVKDIVTTQDEIQELALKPGDIWFNEGGDRDKLGRGWVWNGELPECIHQNHVFRARLYVAALNPKLVSWYANTFGQKFFFDEGKHTTNLASISMSKLKGLPVPIPPPPEQTRIVAEVERRLSVVEELESVVTANLRRASSLRQSILTKAFTGELV